MDDICMRLIREVQRGQRQRKKQQIRDIQAFESGRYKRRQAARKRKNAERRKDEFIKMRFACNEKS